MASEFHSPQVDLLAILDTTGPELKVNTAILLPVTTFGTLKGGEGALLGAGHSDAVLLELTASKQTKGEGDGCKERRALASEFHSPQVDLLAILDTTGPELKVNTAILLPVTTFGTLKGGEGALLGAGHSDAVLLELTASKQTKGEGDGCKERRALASEFHSPQVDLLAILDTTGPELKVNTAILLPVTTFGTLKGGEGALLGAGHSDAVLLELTASKQTKGEGDGCKERRALASEFHTPQVNLLAVLDAAGPELKVNTAILLPVTTFGTLKGREGALFGAGHSDAVLLELTACTAHEEHLRYFQA